MPTLQFQKKSLTVNVQDKRTGCYSYIYYMIIFSLKTQGLGASEKKTKKKLYNTTRGRTHLLPFF
jgi:hypothetical protein